MKRFLALVIFLALAVILIPWLQPGVDAAPGHSAVFVIGRDSYVNDGRTKGMDAVPFLHHDRAYVPVRFLGNALGIGDRDIEWEGATRSVILSPDGVTVRLVVDSDKLSVDGEERTMDVTPLLRDGRVFLPARWVAEALGYEVKWDEAGRAVLVGPPGNLPAPPAGMSGLPVVGDYENLKNLLAQAQAQGERALILNDAKSAAQGVERESLREGAAAPDGGGGAPDYSKTNVQVAGVDEADIVKTDGGYIYQVNGQRIVIARAYPAGEMKLVSTLGFAEKDFSPREMYVDDRYLVVIGQSPGYGDGPIRPMLEGGKMNEIMPPHRQAAVKAVIYDISDKSSPRHIREVELGGRYVSSRKIGPAFYLVANRSIYYHPGGEMEDPGPYYRDTASGGEFSAIDYSQIRYFPGFVRPDYLIVAGVNLDRPDERAQVSAYLGSGENICASTENLYVAVTDYRYGIMEDRPGLLPGPLPTDGNKTRVYKFAMNGGRLTYANTGEVPGAILNQFSMDEYNGYFRIATTRGEVWRTDQYTSRNNIYVLNNQLTTVGKVEDIAPGERIYSVRFLGDRAYMVTFKTVDPLFVIGLKDPRHPEILGALKIPGYSDYLHPYDENHILGFGKDTVEMGQKGGDGEVTGSMAFYTGMKMALFDVSDVNHPVEMFKEVIGDRGTDSELLRNHKALLFSREKNLLAFPVRVMEVDGNGGKPAAGFPEYGRFQFQGAYVYSIDLAKGFALRGKITHLTDEDYLKAGNYWYDSEKNIERILYIDDTLYTLSKKFIKANNLADLKEVNTLEIQ